MSSFGGVRGDRPSNRASHYWNTPEWTRTPRPRSAAPSQLGIELMTRPRQGGARSACSAPCRSACPKLRLAGITDMVEANRWRSSCHNTTPASRPRPSRGTVRPLHRRARRHPVHPRGTHRLKRQHGALQAPGTSDPRRPPPPPLRQGQGSTNTPTAQWPSSMDRDVWRDTTPMANRSTAKPARPRDPLRRDRPAPCGQVDSRSATDHFPTGPETATEAVNSINRSTQNVLDIPEISSPMPFGPIIGSP